MDNTVALTAAAVVLVLIIVILSYLKSKIEQDKQPNALQAVPDQAVGGPRRAAAARNRVGLRNRLAERQRLRDEAAEAMDDDGEANIDDDGDEATSLLDIGDQKVGKKKLAKLEAKLEKARMREAEEKEREERKAKEEERMMERKKQEELEEQLEKEREEQAKRDAEEKARKEHEEYLKMKAAFTVEEQGYDAAEESAQDDLLQRFINYVKENKIVLLEELAASFQLKTQDAIDRLQKLVAEGTLTGVIDDRGKFIYITHEEMEAVAKFIRQRGRVSLADIAESSNQLIQLGSKSQPVESTSS